VAIQSSIEVGGTVLGLAEVEAVARGARVHLAEVARERIGRARAVVDELARAGAAERRPAYGVNTGFGALAEVAIDPAKLRDLQRNLVVSHAAGVGEPYPIDVVRAMVLLRAETLSLGHSGARLQVVEMLLELLNRGVHPVIPSQGSVGASGDLAPLAHLALTLIGEGDAVHDGQRLPAAQALHRVGLTPLVLEAKEGLSLINGTQAMTAQGTLAVQRGHRLCQIADLAGALSLDALLGTPRAFDPRIQALRNHPGQVESAANLRKLLAGSSIVESHRDCKKVQDPYSLRCMPQVHGATRDTLRFVSDVLAREITACTDNPLVFPDADHAGQGEVVSGGNFHGQPVAMALDFAAIGLAELANIAERRIEQLVNPHYSSGLPPFLVPSSGLNSGFMIAQVTAAALVSENKVLCHPASVDSIPSSAGREDHVSMGATAATKLARVVDHVEIVMAIELLCGAQGVDLRRPLRSSAPLEAAWARLRKEVPKLDEDRALYRDIEAARQLVRSGQLIAAVEEVTGPLA
jgi:histidine ammonia-lyase